MLSEEYGTRFVSNYPNKYHLETIKTLNFGWNCKLKNEDFLFISLTKNGYFERSYCYFIATYVYSR